MTDLMQTTLTAPGGVDMALVVGASDEILHVLEESFDARLTVRGDRIVIEGNAVEVQQLTALFADLFKTVEEGQAPRHRLGAPFRRAAPPGGVRPHRPARRCSAHLPGPGHSTEDRRPEALRRRHPRQHGHFRHRAAGTGKTYLAMAMAVAALKRKEVGRIVLSRPIVEAGENLGFLPGTLFEKVDPYIRPLYDALYSMFDQERANALIENGTIEIALSPSCAGAP